MRSPVLPVVVALAGGCVLALEILGTRILGPYYGVSLFLWSSLIAITLAALAIGYALGGRLADAGATGARLSWLLAGAGAWTLAVPWLRDPLLALSDGLGLRAAVLVTATALFFPPLLLLGMVSPYAIRLRARSLDEVGRTAGSLSAISTLASVAAAVATGFWLIPGLGVTRLTLAIGMVLLAAAVLARVGATGRVGATTAAVGIALVAGAWGLPRVTESAHAGTREVVHSPYAEIEVRDRGAARFLLIDGGIHTIVRLPDYAELHPYVVVATLAGDAAGRPGDALLVGLGGGSATRALRREGWAVEAVEIDPEVTRVAERHFGFRRDRVPVAHADGRRFLARADRRWDLILLDAFGSSSIPFHLVTHEAFALAKSRLRAGGVLALNVEAVGWRHPLVSAVAATLRRSFAHVTVLPIAEPPDRLGNLIVLACDRPLEIADEVLGDPVGALSDPYEHWRVLLRRHAWHNRFTPEGGLVLTDDRSPVDVWAEDINRVARRELHAFFADTAGSGVVLGR
uniref:PABS domain-containing protein n=1 Tax=Eiseniibacteriota bacterium TaxID=2212470 RepID=A0A832MLK8_UNCEI